jgi:hypothetical protein
LRVPVAPLMVIALTIACASNSGLRADDLPLFLNLDEIPVGCVRLDEIKLALVYPKNSAEYQSTSRDFQKELVADAKVQTVVLGGNALAVDYLRHSHGDEEFGWAITAIALRCRTEWPTD